MIDDNPAASAHIRCCVCGCVCGCEIVDDEDGAFGTCSDCLDDVHRDPEAFLDQALSPEPYLLRTYQGSEGDVDVGHATLEAAIAAFHAAPVNADPRVLRAGRTLAELDRRLVPVFFDGEARRIHRKLVPEFVLRTFAGVGEGDVDTVHPTLEAAVASFVAAPSHAIPRVVRNGRTVAQLDPEAALARVFCDRETCRIYWRIVSQGVPEHTPSNP